MRLPRTLILAAVIALIALASAGFAKPVTADAMPLSQDFPCWDGSTVKFGQFCPPLPLPGTKRAPVTCPDGTQAPSNDACTERGSTGEAPGVACADGTVLPAGSQCPNVKPSPPVTCPDGTKAPSNDACIERGSTGEAPGVACPDGTVLPAGSFCPTPKPSPPPATCADGSAAPSADACVERGSSPPP